MTTSREIVTLQLGNYANFVGSHWWNSKTAELLRKQEVLKHGKEEFETTPETFFHLPQDSDSCTPRLISLDVKDALGDLSEEGHFVAHSSKSAILSQNALWQGQVEVTQRGEGGKGSPLKNERQIKYWSDFLNTKLHQRSLLSLPFVASDGDLDVNQENVSSKALLEDIEDKIRYFAEACDFLDGFQMLSTVHDGCSQIAIDVLNYLKDDYSNKCTLVAPLAQPRFDQSKMDEKSVSQRLINWCRFFENSWQNSSIIVPLSLSDSLWQSKMATKLAKISGISYDPASDFQTSSILASAFENITIPYSLAASAFSARLGMLELSAFATKYYKMNELRFCYPFPLRVPNQPSPAPVQPVRPEWVSLTPPRIEKERILSRCSVLRGVDVLTLMTQQPMEMLMRNCKKDFENTLESSLPVIDSFVRSHTCIAESPLHLSKKLPKELVPSEKHIIPIASSLISSGEYVGTSLGTLHDECRQLSFIKWQSLLPERTDWGENLEWLVATSQDALNLK